MNPTQYYKNYSTEDKAALKELKAEVEAKAGHEVKLGDMISAVEPELTTPAHLTAY